MTRRGQWVAGTVFFTAITAGCRHTVAENLLAPPPASAVCKVKAIQRSPWIVTLPAENSIDLDTRLSEGGLVAVRYRGCEMSVLTRCKIRGAYRWKSASLAANTLLIESAEELYAKMPIGAVSFEGHLSRGDALRVAYTLSGRYSADRPSVSWDELTQLGGECATATHLVVGAIGGAYDFESIAKASVGASGPFGGGESAAKRAILTSRGKSDACGRGTADEVSPPHNCGAPLKIELAEVICPSTMYFEQEKGCVAGAGGDGDGKRVIVNVSAAESPFATLALDGTRALYNASQSKMVSPAWTSDALTRSAPSVRDRVARLGPVTPVVSQVFVGLVGKDATGTPVSVNTGAYLFPDGRIRWAGFVTRPVNERTPRGVSLAALEPIKERLIGQLLGPKCAIEALDRADIETLPISSELRASLLDTLANTERNRREICTRLAKAEGPWQIGLLQIGMLIASDRTLALVSSDVPLNHGAPTLGGLRLTMMVGDER